jgi:hypothetical protein
MKWISKAVCDRLEREWRMFDRQRPVPAIAWGRKVEPDEKYEGAADPARRLRIGRVD